MLILLITAILFHGFIRIEIVNNAILILRLMCSKHYTPSATNYYRNKIVQVFSPGLQFNRELKNCIIFSLLSYHCPCWPSSRISFKSPVKLNSQLISEGKILNLYTHMVFVMCLRKPPRFSKSVWFSSQLVKFGRFWNPYSHLNLAILNFLSCIFPLWFISFLLSIQEKQKCRRDIKM